MGGHIITHITMCVSKKKKQHREGKEQSLHLDLSSLSDQTVHSQAVRAASIHAFVHSFLGSFIRTDALPLVQRGYVLVNPE